MVKIFQRRISPRCLSSGWISCERMIDGWRSKSRICSEMLVDFPNHPKHDKEQNGSSRQSCVQCAISLCRMWQRSWSTLPRGLILTRFASIPFSSRAGYLWEMGYLAYSQVVSFGGGVCADSLSFWQKTVLDHTPSRSSSEILPRD